MRPLQSVQRRTGFETLEAKKLFAADLVGGAAIDLPDTAVVAGFDPGDLVAELDPGDLYSVEMNPGDGLLATLPYVGLRQQADTVLVSEIQSGKLTPTPNGSSFSGWSGEQPLGGDGIRSALARSLSRALQCPSDQPVSGDGIRSAPPNGSSFSGWNGEGCSGTGTCTITVDNKDYVNNIGTENPSEMVINDGLADSPGLGGQEGEPVTAPVSDMVFESLGGQEGEPVVAGLWQDCNNAIDSNDCPGIIDAGLTGPIGGTLDRTPEVIDSNDTTNIEINLGGQEGEDFNLDPGNTVSGVAAVHTSGVVDFLASSKTSEFLHGNTNNAISMANTAEGGLNEISGIVIRMRELAVQSANGDFQVTDQHYFAVR